MSLREAGKGLGKNHATIAHIDGGRTDVRRAIDLWVYLLCTVYPGLK